MLRSPQIRDNRRRNFHFIFDFLLAYPRQLLPHILQRCIIDNKLQVEQDDIGGSTTQIPKDVGMLK